MQDSGFQVVRARLDVTYVATNRTSRAILWLSMQSLVVDKTIALNVPGICHSCVRGDITLASAKTAFMHLMQRSTYEPQSRSLQVIFIALNSVEHSTELLIGVTPAEAAVATDAVNTAYHAITRRGEVKRDETVFLFGLGGLGLNALQILIHIGARVIVSDIRQELLDEAQKLGIPSRDLVPVGTPPQQFIAENDLSGKIDTVLDFVGTHQTFEDAQHIGQFPVSFRRALHEY